MASSRCSGSPGPSTDFAGLVHEPFTENGRLQRGVELVVALVGGCDHAGVTILTSAFMETVAASDDLVRRGDGWQYELNEGPGLDSVRGRTTVVSQDLRVDPRWRAWGPRVASGLGVRSTLSVLLETRGAPVGSLTLYADRVDAWGDEQQAQTRILAAQLALAVFDARMLDERERELVSRTGIAQAQGIVMERLGVSAGQAADYLDRLSRETHVRVLHLAERIVETRELPLLKDWGRRPRAGRRVPPAPPRRGC